MWLLSLSYYLHPSLRRIDDPLLQLLQGLEHRFVKAWLFLVEPASCLSPVLSPLASLLGAPGPG